MYDNFKTLMQEWEHNYCNRIVYMQSCCGNKRGEKSAFPKEYSIKTKIFRVLIMSVLIFMCILLLSVERVPEKILGIRSPERVLEVFNENQNASNVSVMPAVGHNASHLLQKRHIPHKFWARARPHNKFRKKKHHQKPMKENLDGKQKLFHNANANNIRYDFVNFANQR
ncbi:uncharacterized protein [Palaemon carinicauda]|uniref:uncharacterized protein isoform X4 n=1 Tax=Palaemon carinicauda TaxID=392227 RepID=UPI0035B5DCCD